MPIALDAKPINHIEVGPPEPLSKIGLEAIGKQSTRKKPTKMPWGGIIANFFDPDLNELQVVQDPEHYNRPTN